MTADAPLRRFPRAFVNLRTSPAQEARPGRLHESRHTKITQLDSRVALVPCWRFEEDLIWPYIGVEDGYLVLQTLAL